MNKTTEKMKIGKLTRSMQMDMTCDPQNPDVIRCAISSEYPVERWFGTEILSHKMGAIDMSRLEGGPLLLNHDMTEQIGAIQNITLDSDFVLRGDMRFSRSEDGCEIKNDVIDGIRKNISVGYIVDEFIEEPKGVFTATRWTPYEVSIVAVPADPTVGAGRNLEDTPETTVKKNEEEITQTVSEYETQTIKQEPTEAGVNNMEQTTAQMGEIKVQATKEAAEVVRLASTYGFSERASEWLDKGLTVSQVSQEILKLQSERSVPIQQTKQLELTNKEQKNYSMVRAIMSSVDVSEGKKASNFEMEIHDELSRSQVSSHGGILVPFSVRAGLDSATSTKGTELKFTEAGSFIEMLRNKQVVAPMGATIMTGLNGNISFPKQSTGATATWVTENPGSDGAESNLTLGSVAMSPKTLQATTSYSRQLLAQAVIDIDNLVRNDLALINAIAIDLAAINGSGLSNQPKGILNTTGVNPVTIGNDGGAPTYAKIVELFSAIEDANADLGAYGLITSAIMKGKLKTTSKFANTGFPIWEGETVDGYKAMASKQVPSGLTKGNSTDCYAIIAGVWNQLMVGYWGRGFEIIVDPNQLKKQAMIEVTTFILADVALRNAASFAKIVDARNV